MKKRKGLYRPSGESGSAVIFILWILVIVIFLAGEYLAHNRGKAAMANHAMDSLKSRQAVESVLHLFATEGWPLPADMGSDDTQLVKSEQKSEEEGGGKDTVKKSPDKYGTWTDLSPGGFDLAIRVEDESGKIDINAVPEAKLREKIRLILGDERLEEADRISDAILDWRDADSLVRTDGAETRYYEDKNLAYVPANGKFKAMAELLLVKDVTPDLFWGDWAELETEEDVEDESDGEADEGPSSLIGVFTIFPKDVKSIGFKIPGRSDGYTAGIVYLKKEKNRWQMVDRVSALMETRKGDN